jgi:nucleoside-diphosphate-sugar epimerase
MNLVKLIFFISIITPSISFSLNLFNLNRRDLFHLAAGVSYLSSKQYAKPVCIIGANGETGKECMKLLANNKTYVRAISRKKIDIDKLELDDINAKKYIDSLQFDIRSSNNIDNIIKGTSSVIFLANAKKKYRYIKTDVEEYQNYEDVDVMGLENVAKACVKNNIPRLVYVSGSCKSCTDDPELEIDKICGIECENCRTKQAGENIIRNIYKNSNLDYTIIRIGYLINGENRGPTELEINQDYTKSGMISRIDLANICLNSINNPKTARTTFEAYYKDTTQPYDAKDSLQLCTNLGKSIEECFFGSEFKDKKPKNMDEVRNKPIKGSLFTTGNEYQGENWSDLFKNIRRDDSNPYLDLDNKKKEVEFDDDNSNILYN